MVIQNLGHVKCPHVMKKEHVTVKLAGVPVSLAENTLIVKKLRAV
jgi:hypothetical protein